MVEYELSGIADRAGRSVEDVLTVGWTSDMIADVAGVTARYIRAECQAGRLPAVKPGRDLIVRHEDALVWFGERGIEIV